MSDASVVPVDCANPWLNDLICYIPGKPIDDVARELGLSPEQIVKLASNENPIGPSPKALEAMREALTKSHFYPDGGGYHLRKALSEKFRVPLDQVLLGNGSNEIIEFLGHAFLQPGDNIVTAKHAFAIYRLMAQLFGADTIEAEDPDFTADPDAMAAAVNPRTKLLYLANPNNPTGTGLNEEQLDRLINQIPPNVVIALDEAYYEFLSDAPDSLKYLKERENVILLRTFSKIQGLAGLRIGYGFCSRSLANVLHKTRQPFNANSIAQAGALAAVQDDDHMERTRKITDEGRAYMEAGFRKRHLEFVPSSANFILVKVGDAQDTFKKLLQRGMIIRAMNEYKLPEWIRVSVGTAEQNRRFFEDLDAIGFRAP